MLLRTCVIFSYCLPNCCVWKVNRHNTSSQNTVNQNLNRRIVWFLFPPQPKRTIRISAGTTPTLQILFLKFKNYHEKWSIKSPFCETWAHKQMWLCSISWNRLLTCLGKNHVHARVTCVIIMYMIKHLVISHFIVFLQWDCKKLKCGTSTAVPKCQFKVTKINNAHKHQKYFII